MRSLVIAVLLTLSLGCGGRRVGNEEYFAGAPLPAPEPDAPATTAPSASAAVSATASAAKLGCHDSPAGGFPHCDAAKSNAPCAFGAVGGCLIQCGGAEPPVPGPCPTAPAPR